LAIEGGVLNVASQEQDELFLDRCWRYLDLFLFLDIVAQFASYLTHDVVDMLAALERADAVNERDLGELVRWRERNGVFPTLSHLLIGSLALIFGTDIEVDVLLKVFHGNNQWWYTMPVPDLDLLDRVVRHSSNVVDTLFQESEHVFGQARNAKSAIVGFEDYSGIGFGTRLDLGHNRRFDGFQVIAKLLHVLESTNVIHGFDAAIRRPDQDQFESEPVLATDDLLLGLVVVGRRTQVSENHLGDPDVVFGVFRYIDTISIVGHGDRAILGDGRIDERDKMLVRIGRLDHTHDVIAAINDAFIEKFVQSGNVFDLFVNDAAGCIVENPHVCVHIFDGADIGIGIIENVLTVSLALVLFGEGVVLGFRRRSGR